MVWNKYRGQYRKFNTSNKKLFKIRCLGEIGVFLFPVRIKVAPYERGEFSILVQTGCRV